MLGNGSVERTPGLGGGKCWATSLRPGQVRWSHVCDADTVLPDGHGRKALVSAAAVQPAWSCVWVAPGASVAVRTLEAVELEQRALPEVPPLSGSWRQGDRVFWKPYSFWYMSYFVIKTCAL